MKKHSFFVSFINSYAKPDLMKFCAESIAKVGFDSIHISICFHTIYTNDQIVELKSMIKNKLNDIRAKYPLTIIDTYIHKGPLLSIFDYFKIIVSSTEEKQQIHDNDKILIMNGDDMILKYEKEFDNHDFIAGYNFISNRIEDNDTDKMNIHELINSIDTRIEYWDQIIEYGGSIIPYWFIKFYLFNILENERILTSNYPYQTKKKLIVLEKTDFLRELRHQNQYIPNEPFIFHRLWETNDKV